MKLDSQGSQFTSAVGSQRLKLVPDVLFVDEEGNPIEAGHENLIYVDEQGNEIPEEIAQQLLESGKYIDSRDLYLAADAMSLGGGDTMSNANGPTANGAGSTSASVAHGQQYELTQPSLPASAFGSLSKSTGANEVAITRKSSYQSLKSGAGVSVGVEDDQRTSFTQAQVKMKQREDELREIEADAQAVAAAVVAAAAAPPQQQPQQPNKSTSNTDMQKSHSGRRLLQPPPLKNSQDFKSQESIRRLQAQQQQLQQTSSSDRPSSSQQVFDLHQLINSQSSKDTGGSSSQHHHHHHHHSNSHHHHRQSSAAESSDQLDRQVRSRQGRSQRKMGVVQQRQQASAVTSAQPSQFVVSDGGSYYEVAGVTDQTDETGDDVQSQLTEQHILEMREQQMLREKLLRKQQEYLEQQEYARLRAQSTNYEDDQQQAAAAAYLQQQQQQQQEEQQQQQQQPEEQQPQQQEREQQEDTGGEETVNGTDDEYFRQLSRNFTQSVGSTNMISPSRQPVGQHRHHHHHHHHHHNNHSSSSAAIVSTGSHLAPASLINNATREKLKGYLKDFHVEQLRQVGSLSGKNVIYNLGKIDLSEFDRFYSNVSTAAVGGGGDETTYTSNSRVGGAAGLISSGVGIGESTLGGGAGADEIDPYDPNLFKDEIIDIDFGAIDAYTAGLNAQINAEKANNSSSRDPGQLQFPSHILTSNHATFIDNQMLLGDAFFSQSAAAAAASAAAANGQQAHESTSNLNGNNNQNGMNMQFFSSVNDLQQSEGGGSYGFDINTQSQLNNNSLGGGVGSGGVGSGGGGGAGGSIGGGSVDYGDEVVNVGGVGGSVGGGDQYSPSNSFGSMVDIQSQQTYSIGDLNQLQQQAGNLNTIVTGHDYHSSSYQPTSSVGNVTLNNYYAGGGGGGGDNAAVNYTSQYQQTSNSNANIGSANSKMKNSFTNSSAIYNVNNYISR